MFSFGSMLFYIFIASSMYYVPYALGLFKDQATAGVAFIFAAAMSIVITIKLGERLNQHHSP